MYVGDTMGVLPIKYTWLCAVPNVVHVKRITHVVLAKRHQ